METVNFVKGTGTVIATFSDRSVEEFPHDYRVEIAENNSISVICTVDVNRVLYKFVDFANIKFAGVAVTTRAQLESKIEEYFYTVTSSGSGGGGTGGNNIQFKDEGVALGTAGTVTDLNFAGLGVTATRVTNQVNVTIPQSRFGVAGEDAVATQQRSFNLGTNYQISIQSANLVSPAILINHTGGGHAITAVTQGAYCLNGTSEGSVVVATSHATSLTFPAIAAISLQGGVAVSGATSTGIGFRATVNAGGIPCELQTSGADVSSVLTGLKLNRLNTANNGTLAGQGIDIQVFNRNATNSNEKTGAIVWKYANPAGPSSTTLQIQLKSSLNTTMLDIINANPLGDVSFPNIRTYADDAAADADSTLPSKSFYLVTGSRIPHFKL